MNLLHLDSSILGERSASRVLSASVVAKLTGANAALRVTYRDLAAAPIAHLSGAYLAAGAGGPSDAAVQADLIVGSTALEEFLAADIVVIGVGFYNFGIPSQLKAWIDRIAIAGKTFRYTDTGPQGLVGGKRIVIAIARGGFYGAGSPAAPFEHAETYLRGVFGFLGISAIEVVSAEGLSVGPEARRAALEQAESKIAALSV